MIINLSPVRMDETITVIRQGDVLTVNGEDFDFGPLSDGSTLPAEAIGSDHFAGPVKRIGSELHLTLRLPHGANPSHAMAFPEPIIMTTDGVVPLPAEVEDKE